MYCNNYEKIKTRIEEESKNIPKCCFCIGATGPQDPAGSTGSTDATGPTGSTEPTVECACVAQMTNIIEQIIALYPNDNLIIAM